MKFFNKLKRYYIDHIRPSHEKKVNYLRDKGAVIGEGTRLNCTTTAFGLEPYLIKVGQNCLFAANINLITHDGAIKVLNSLNRFEGKMMDKIGSITIGDNVYIGMGAYIMPNTIIGNDCIIGAGAIVKGNIPEKSVVVGIPGRVVCSIDDYYERCKDKLEWLDGMSVEEKKKYLIQKYRG